MAIDVDADRDEDASLRADAGAQRSEQERERNADELHHHERGDLRVLVDADLGAVDARPFGSSSGCRPGRAASR